MKPQRNRARDIGFYVLILVLLACTLFTLLNQEPENELSYAQVKDLFKEEKVQEFTYNGSKNLLEMKVKDSSAKDGYKTVYYKMYSFSLFYEEFGELIDQQYDKGIIKDYQIEPVQSTWWLQLIPYVLFIGFMVFWIVMMQRAQGGGGAGGAMKFGKARTRLGSEEKNRKTFNDVAGADEEKAELQELVEFLKDPKSFTKMGARIPKGVLLVGPPGVATFILPENCWTEHYFAAKIEAQKIFLHKYAGNKIAEEFSSLQFDEEELYSKYKAFYGYTFFIAKKIEQ